MALQSRVIEEVFKNDSNLKRRIYDIINQRPELLDLFVDISEYVVQVGKVGSPTTLTTHSKKRKLDRNGTNGADNAGDTRWLDETPFFRADDSSVSMPQRKKLRLEFVRGGGIKAINPTSSEIEYTIRWENIDQIFSFPVPDKSTRQYNYVVLPTGDSGASADQGSQDQVQTDPLVWTVPDGAAKTISIGAAADGQETYQVATSRSLADGLGRPVTVPQRAEFVSSLAQGVRKGDVPWHVRAFRGSKEGYLYFLAPGIFWGFKKPLMFFSLPMVASVSYTSVLSRTFNLLVSKSDGEEVEFGMLDQGDFDGIDAYIKRHGLNDASMAEQRRAKWLNVNDKKGQKGADDGQSVSPNDTGGPEDGETELQRAERLLQDEEDAEEEDFVPGSGESSDGSSGGSDRGEDHDDGDDDDGDDDDDDEASTL